MLLAHALAAIVLSELVYERAPFPSAHASTIVSVPPRPIAVRLTV